MSESQEPVQQIACSYVLVNNEAQQVKIGATKCLTRRLWEHESGLDGFQLEFYVPCLHPFVLERFLHKYVAENDLVIEYCQKREVYKCELESALESLKEYILSRQKLVWYTTVYANQKTATLLRQPVRRDFNKHVWEGRLEIKNAFQEYVKPDYWKMYYQQHRDLIKERSKNYYHTNKETLLPKMKARYSRIRTEPAAQENPEANQSAAENNETE